MEEIVIPERPSGYTCWESELDLAMVLIENHIQDQKVLDSIKYHLDPIIKGICYDHNIDRVGTGEIAEEKYIT